MTKKTIFFLIIFFLIASSITGGVWYWEKSTQKSENTNRENIETPSTGQEDSVITNKNNDTVNKDLVWYDIPELGVRFKVSPEVKDELVYYKTPNLDGVDFSTRTLESISEDCSAKGNAPPLGGISRVYGSPTDPIAPCGGGHKVKEFPGGYFCYTQSQAPCLSREQEKQNQEVLSETPGSALFMSKEFWDSAEVIK